MLALTTAQNTEIVNWDIWERDIDPDKVRFSSIDAPKQQLLKCNLNPDKTCQTEAHICEYHASKIRLTLTDQSEARTLQTDQWEWSSVRTWVVNTVSWSRDQIPSTHWTGGRARTYHLTGVGLDYSGAGTSVGVLTTRPVSDVITCWWRHYCAAFIHIRSVFERSG